MTCVPKGSGCYCLRDRHASAGDAAIPVIVGVSSILFALLVLLSVAASLSQGRRVNYSSPSGVELPAYVYESGVITGAAEAYQAAVDHPELLAEIPCMCGSGLPDRYASSLDWFIYFMDEKRVDFNRFGSTCPVCVNMALDVSRWNEEGYTLEEIKVLAEKKYSVFDLS